MLKELQHKIDFKTKPIGSLGSLESIALKIGAIQQSLTPSLINPTIIVFAGDHGLAKEGVSAYPQEVTYQMVMNFLSGGAAINVFTALNGLRLKVVDSGVNFDFAPHEQLIDAKIAKGTASFLSNKAMTTLQIEECISKGKEIVKSIHDQNCNVIGFGEMGIGNTSSSSLIMSSICDFPIEKCVGRGTGLNDHQLNHKLEVLKKAQAFHGNLSNPFEILQTYGGFEIAQMVGAMIGSFEKNMLILVDGFIASSAFLIAHSMHPEIINNALFCHLSDEFGHKNLLAYLKVDPILNLNMRLGEGTGCAVAFPIIQSAVAFLNQMASFESAGVSNR
jgi:nicotinate-nucleotide--dimethylbenzimidazole phosphoribosyltransferase